MQRRFFMVTGSSQQITTRNVCASLVMVAKRDMQWSFVQGQKVSVPKDESLTAKEQARGQGATWICTSKIADANLGGLCWPCWEREVGSNLCAGSWLHTFFLGQTTHGPLSPCFSLLPPATFHMERISSEEILYIRTKQCPPRCVMLHWLTSE